MRRKKLYLSGAITNNPNYKQDFAKTRRLLIEAGYCVVDPIIFCEGIARWDACMRECLQILSRQTAVAVIDTPHESKGRDLELEIARTLNMEIKTVEEWVKEAQK